MLDTRRKSAEHITGQVPVCMVYDAPLSMMSNGLLRHCRWVQIEARCIQPAVAVVVATAAMQVILNLHHHIHPPAMQAI